MRHVAFLFTLLLGACTGDMGNLNLENPPGLSIQYDSTAPVTQRQHACPDGPMFELRNGPYSLSQLEQIGFKFSASDPKYERVSFGRGNRGWEKLASSYKSGDKIYYYTISADKLTPYAGGYALSRGGCVVSAFGVWVS